MEDTRVLGTVWKERCLLWWLYKDINQEKTAEKRFPAEVFTRHSKIPQGIGTICITICCCLSGDPRDRSLRRNHSSESSLLWRRALVFSLRGKRRSNPSSALLCTGNQQDPQALSLPSICFSILVVGWCPFFFFNFATGPHRHFSYSLLPLIFVCFAFIFGDPPNSKVSPIPFNFTILPLHPGQGSGLKHEKVSSPSCKLGKIILS